jgi:hypothetical protein
VQRTTAANISDWRSVTEQLTKKRPSISGYVQVQRKTAWVKRFATIDGDRANFKYKDNERDADYKIVVNLKTAKIKKGRKNGSQPYIYIERNGKDSLDSQGNEVIRVAFTSEDVLSRWMRAIMVATMSDEELLQSAREMSENIGKVVEVFDKELGSKEKRAESVATLVQGPPVTGESSAAEKAQIEENKAEPVDKQIEERIVEKPKPVKTDPLKNWNVIAFDASRPPVFTQDGIVVLASVPSQAR